MPDSTNSTGSLTKTTYDLGGRPIRIVEPDGGVTTLKYDFRGLLLSEKQCLTINGSAPDTECQNGTGVVMSYAYDSMGRLTSVTDPLGRVTRMKYDTLGRLIEEKLPDAKATLYTYDTLGRLTTWRDPNGTVVTNTYDDGDRLIGRSILRGTGVTGPTSEIYTYDALDRLISGKDSLSGTG